MHLKHYHMSVVNFKRRTSALRIPDGIYQLYEQVVKECAACNKKRPEGRRPKIGGIWARDVGHVVAGDTFFYEHNKAQQAASLLRGIKITYRDRSVEKSREQYTSVISR